MTPNRDRRKPNGKRIEGLGLAAKIAQEVNGMMLAEAFVAVRSAGFQLNVTKLDGVPRKAALNSDVLDIVNVDVIDGIVKRGWVG